MSTGRKDPRNFGTATSKEIEDRYPNDAETVGDVAIVMPERVILSLLRLEVDRLALPANRDQLVRFFSHFFDPMMTVEERNTYVDNFQAQPPVTVLGYPRTGSEFPCYSVVLENEQEGEPGALDHFMGRTEATATKPVSEYLGALFEQTYGVFVYAEHPDVCLYLYHLAKLILLGSHAVLEESGIMDPEFSGGELSPDETYIPENMFVRRVGVNMKTIQTVPDVLRPDPSRLRTGIWVDDIVVSGVRGGVTGVR